MLKIKQLILKLFYKKELNTLLSYRELYWINMENSSKDNENFIYYQTRRCELERIINYLFGLKY